MTEQFLTRIWNLERTERPGLIVEEAPFCPPLPGADYADQVCLTEIQKYLLLTQSCRDDNVPAVDPYRGSYVAATIFGAQERVFEDGHRYLAAPVIFDAADVDRIRKPQVLSALVGEQVDMIRRCARTCGPQTWVRVGDIQNPLGVAAMLWDSSFYTALVEQPKQVHALLEIITDVTIEYVHAMQAAAPRLVAMCWPKVWAPPGRGLYIADDTMTLISPALYEEFGVPYNNRLSREFGGLMLHTCSLKARYFPAILKNEGLRSINFAAQYSADLHKIFDFFGGKAVIIPHYCHTDSPQIGTLPEFIDQVLDCWRPDTPALIYVGPKVTGGPQPEVFDAFARRGFDMEER